MPECYSCGTDVESLSNRDFCAGCETEVKAGEDHAAQVEYRAEILEKAKEEGDFNTVGRIAGEIAQEFATNTTPVEPVAVAPVATTEGQS